MQLKTIADEILTFFSWENRHDISPESSAGQKIHMNIWLEDN